MSPRRRANTATNARWERFLARNAFACPNCGYDMHGLKSTACPECGRQIDAETAMFVSAPAAMLGTMQAPVGLLLIASLNLALFVAEYFALHPLACTQYHSHPPLEYYGLLTLRLGWFFTIALGIATWWLDVRGTRPEEE